MLKAYWARILGRINDRHFRLFMAIRYQKMNPFWMADRREYRDRGGFWWLVLPSDRFYADQRNPYRINR